jgi:putative sterol carrier protein
LATEIPAYQVHSKSRPDRSKGELKFTVANSDNFASPYDKIAPGHIVYISRYFIVTREIVWFIQGGIVMATGKYRYLSPEWAEEVLRRVNEKLSPERMKHITSSMLTVNTSCPDGKDRAIYYEIVDGIVTDVSIREGELPRAEFTITADYELFARISRGEL